VNLIRLADVVAERVSWLWLYRIPLGKVTVLDGDPGLGKSAMSLDIAARVSRGYDMPDRTPSGAAAGVVILSAEDGLGDTIRPRLEVAGADIERIMTVTNDEDLISIPGDLRHVRSAIQEVKAALLIIDPLTAYLGSDINANRDQDVRRALAPLGKLAEATHAAVLVIRHLTKSVANGSPLYRGGGSIGIIGAARAGLLVAQDPEDESVRILASTKSNLAARQPSLTFRLEEVRGTVRVVWGGQSGHSAASLLAVGPPAKGALAEAAEFLEGVLRQGPVLMKTVEAAANVQGISTTTLRRAHSHLNVKARKQSQGPWTWELPQTTAELDVNDQTDVVGNVDHLGNLQSVDPRFSADSSHFEGDQGSQPDQDAQRGESISSSASDRLVAA
jgi:hypothetical protein